MADWTPVVANVRNQRPLVLPSSESLVKAVEDRLRREGQRLLLIDTSGTPEFDHVHRFYGSLGFTLEARIGNYWAAGDDKVTFSKPLI